MDEKIMHFYDKREFKKHMMTAVNDGWLCVVLKNVDGMYVLKLMSRPKEELE